MIKSLVTYVAIGLVLGAGILLMMKGQFWLLLLGLLIYLFLFIKYGCLSH